MSKSLADGIKLFKDRHPRSNDDESKNDSSNSSNGNGKSLYQQRHSGSAGYGLQVESVDDSDNVTFE